MFSDHPTIAIDPIPGFPGYFVCRLGAVFSTNGRWSQCLAPLRTQLNSGGYLSVNLWRNGKRHTRLIHRLILETYVGPKPDGAETRHLNNVRFDNRLSNLRWGTPRENGADIRRAGSKKGMRHPNAKLTDDDVRIIRTMRPRDAARKFGISQATASDIRARRTWQHIE